MIDIFNSKLSPSQHFSNSCKLLENTVQFKISEIAKSNPNAIAIRYGKIEISYSELNERANQIAHYLLSKPMEQDARIVVFLEPSPNIVFGLLGILKAGAVYVPIDPSYPPGRIQAILEVVKPTCILTEKYLVPHLNNHDIPLLFLDDFPPVNHPEEVQKEIKTNQTAYIFFTSGSTGAPKGVMATYSNLSHFTQVATERYHMSSHTIMPTIARFTFSISLFELLCPLVAGGTIVIVDRVDVLNLEKMVSILSEVTMFHAGPSLLKKLLPYIHQHVRDFSIFSKIEHASSGGDMIPPDTLESLKHICSNAEIFVIYGSTEIACMGCTYPVLRNQEISKTYVGKPFNNTRVCIIDENLNELPLGVEGEVCFSGAGLAKGYLNQPDLTDEKFITMANGERYYRMGDLGRINSEGDLELLGRTDFQIKIRGMRVELGEVEYLLRKGPGVKDAVVAGWDLGYGDITLIGYIVFKDNHQKQIREINELISYHLPDYMIPSAYVELSELPLNFNMKLDRKALPDPRHMELLFPSRHTIRVPVSASEITISNFFKELLHQQDIGLDDNFFELGGHSSLAVELLMKIKDKYGITLDGLEVLRETVELIAKKIDISIGHACIPKQNQNIVYKNNKIVTESFYFGPEESLYGVIHRSKEQIKKAVLVCSPMPYEDERLDFVLNRLARKLLTHNIACMQFHYFGTRNSKGDGIIDDISLWHQNIKSASDELQIRCDVNRVTCLGVRFGANLLWDIAPFIACENLIVWDPILDGNQYLLSLERQHTFSSKRNGFIWKNFKQKGPKELLGMRYSEKYLNQLARVKLEDKTNVESLSWIVSTEMEQQITAFTSLGIPDKNALKVKIIVPNFNWLDSLNQMPDTGISDVITNIVRDL